MLQHLLADRAGPGGEDHGWLVTMRELRGRCRRPTSLATSLQHALSLCGRAGDGA